MTTYYLQHSAAERRNIIDTVVHKGAEVSGTTEASSWIEAKMKFGFELTQQQERMSK